MNSIEFAIKMEQDGEKYYLEQAEKNQSKELKSVFLMLAEEERAHATLLKSKADNLPYELNDVFTELENVFRGMRDIHNEIKFTPDALDAYRLAMNNEKESVNLYKKLYEESKDDNEKELFQYLIRQENEHLSIMEELVELLSHSVEWVENAEFGIRKEY